MQLSPVFLLILAVSIRVGAQCENRNQFCNFWALIQGECEKSPQFMRAECPKACKLCQVDGSMMERKNAPFVGQVADSDPYCCFWAMRGECQENPFWMRPSCQRSCGTPGCSIINAHECPVYLNLENCPWMVTVTPSPTFTQPKRKCSPVTAQSVLSFLAAYRSELQVLWKELEVELGPESRRTQEERVQMANDYVEGINQHNSNPDVSYCKGLNKFSFMSSEELKYFRGFSGETTESQPTDERIPVFKFQLQIKYQLNNQHDYTPSADSVDWTSIAGSIGDQGPCQSSWAFAAADTFTAIETLEQQSNRNYSVQQLTNCVPGGCRSRGNPVNGWKFWERFRPLTNTELPYSPKASSPCTPEQKQPQPSNIATVVRTVSPDQQVAVARSAEEQLEKVLQKHPVAAGFHVTDEFQRAYSEGIFESAFPSCGENLNHAVVVVGYGTENGIPYWKLKNSWGSTWGEKGYFRVKRGVNTCGIASDISFPVLRLQPSTTTRASTTTKTMRPTTTKTKTFSTTASTTTMMLYRTTTMMQYPTTMMPYPTTMMAYPTTTKPITVTHPTTTQSTTPQAYCQCPPESPPPTNADVIDLFG